MEPLIQCIYSSTSTPNFEEHHLPKILECSRRNNARLEVSGMLLYIEGSFFQVLEGSPEHVDPLYQRICLDPRHMRITQIIREPIFQRQFGDWSMGFSTLSLKDAGHLTGENDFFRDASCLQKLGRSRAKKLLSAFKEGRWRADRTGQFRTADLGNKAR